MHTLKIISQQPESKNKLLIPYDIDGEKIIGAFGNEAYAIQFENQSYERVEVRISIDGTDIVTGKPATTGTEGDRWVVGPHDSLTLVSWPESQQGGARFLFTDSKSGVAAHTHGVMRDVGVIAAAVFTERPEPSYKEQYTSGPLRGPRGQSAATYRGVQSTDSSMSLETERTSRSIAGTGAGEYAEQKIAHVRGLHDPVYTETIRVRYLWWDDLVAKLRAKGVVPSASGNPGFPGDPPFGVNLGSTPRGFPPNGRVTVGGADVSYSGVDAAYPRLGA